MIKKARRIKTLLNRNENTKWIIDNFPTNYENFSYLEPFITCESVFYNKIPSVEEALNDNNKDLVNLFRVIRDESKELVKTIKNNEHEELVKVAEFLKEKGRNYTKENLEAASKRLQNVYILNKEPIEVIRAFNSEKCFIYVFPPIPEEVTSKSLDYQSNISNILKNFKGMVMARVPIGKFYNNLYKGWECFKNQDKNQAIWMNY